MNDEFAEFHDQLRTLARELLEKAGPDPVPWATITSAGWPGLAAPVEFDGAGATFAEVAVLLGEVGRAAAGTALPNVLALSVPALVDVAADALRDKVLRETIAGLVLPVLTLDAGSDADPAFVLESTSDGPRLCGNAGFVLDATAADLLLVPVRESSGNWLLVAVAPDTRGLSITAVPLVDATRSAATVIADQAAVRAVWRFRGSDVPAGLRARAAVAIACDSLGSADAMLAATVDYVRVREQFGRPVGSFQAVKHACADLLVQVTVARQLVDAGVRAIAEGAADATVAAAKAKAYTTGVAVRVAGAAMQLHGGYGYTWDSGVHVHLKRATLNRALFGTPATHRKALAARYA
ncbi:acyl-CoA dehydrogenase family protein [Nocardia rhizosphaerihabitans]|uniref:Acyl-CoA dehydrogenase n=1 Tax=Nocardia rhizosphaerihabitans TaxID=1691570 RepID=A0ABQ2L225_9NOCA|nr:acyl-CoA dehydrogenase family protein [Nocardia rhizosphaerihabitans]GGN97470.1 acyl-CoA dehydrogenase [Nocardia rhizosphaerihabitans]